MNWKIFLEKISNFENSIDISKLKYFDFNPWPYIRLSLFNKWNGARQDYRLDDLNNPEQVKIQAYDLMDFTVQKSFWKERIKINAGIRNLLDVSNINSSSSGGAHSSSEGSQIASGRTYFIGLKISTGN